MTISESRKDFLKGVVARFILLEEWIKSLSNIEEQSYLEGLQITGFRYYFFVLVFLPLCVCFDNKFNGVPFPLNTLKRRVKKVKVVKEKLKKLSRNLKVQDAKLNAQYKKKRLNKKAQSLQNTIIADKSKVAHIPAKNSKKNYKKRQKKRDKKEKMQELLEKEYLADALSLPYERSQDQILFKRTKIVQKIKNVVKKTEKRKESQARRRIKRLDNLLKDNYCKDKNICTGEVLYRVAQFTEKMGYKERFFLFQRFFSLGGPYLGDRLYSQDYMKWVAKESPCFLQFKGSKPVDNSQKSFKFFETYKHRSSVLSFLNLCLNTTNNLSILVKSKLKSFLSSFDKERDKEIGEW